MMYNVLGIVEKERDLCVSVGDISFSIFTLCRTLVGTSKYSQNPCEGECIF